MVRKITIRRGSETDYEAHCNTCHELDGEIYLGSGDEGYAVMRSIVKRHLRANPDHSVFASCTQRYDCDIWDA